MKEQVIISKSKEKNSKVDWELVEQFKKGLEDLKAGRYKRVR